MIRQLIGIAVMMSALALGAGVARAETRNEEGQGHHHGKMHEACKADMEKFCKDTVGDHQAMRKCMQAHENELSDGCKQAREEMKKHE
jgi:hypothetical protein